MGEVAIQRTERETFLAELQKMEERIVQRAHGIFQGNGSVLGKDLDNWLAAERELVWKPPIEMTEKDNRYEIKVAVAGVDPKDISVEVTSDGVLVKGETRTEKKGQKGEIHTSEFQTGSLFRSIHFPKNVDASKVTAEIKNGLLTIIAPVAAEVKAPKVKAQTA